MKRSVEEPQRGNNNIIVDEVQYPRLNLPLTKTPELINSIESYLQQLNPCPHEQKTSTCPKNTEKIKAMNFPISKITIGQWTTDSVYDDDIVAKFYFSKKKLLWEFLLPDKQVTHMERLKRKIEIDWDDVMSVKRSFHSRDETGILEVELRKRPTFCIETNPQAGKHTQWKTIQDFTETQSSLCRRHTLHFKPGVLQKNFEKLVSSNSFWSQLVKVPFPLNDSPYFDIAYENNNSISFNDFQHYHSFQGTGHVGGGNFNMATPRWPNDGMQINSYGQANSENIIANQFRGMQATIPMSSQVIYGHCNTGICFTGSQDSNLMIQYNVEMQNRGGLLGSHAYVLPDNTQSNLLMNQHMNEFSMYPPPPGSYLASTILQEEERQYKEEYTHLGGNVQIDGYQQKGFNQSGHNYSYPYMSTNNYTYMGINNGPVIADMKDDFNDEEF